MIRFHLPFRRLFSVPAAAFSALAATFSVELHAARGCGTALLFSEDGRLPPGDGLSARTRAGNLPSRLWETEHFALRYRVRGLHQPHWTAQDASLRQSIDSLWQSFGDAEEEEEGGARDSLLHVALAEADLPHPEYIRTLAALFESVYAYYVDTLGMRPVTGIGSSRVFASDGGGGQKFPVDVVDIGTADSRYQGEYYGITFPSPTTILLENDFLYNAALDSNGNVTGLPIRSIVDQVVLKDYSEAWEAGLRVTIAHEFYHAVQFAYIPSINRYHAWYEISAVGMEERLAPDVDDYFQYLPCILRNPGRVTLFQESRGPCTHAPWYGNGIFFQYLTAELGPRFDVGMWEELARNGSKLEPALDSLLGRHARDRKKLWADYAFQLASSGLEVETEAPLFSGDIPRWPRVARDTLPAGAFELGATALSLPALSFRVGVGVKNPGTESHGVLGQDLTGADRWLREGSRVQRLPSSSGRPSLFSPTAVDEEAWVWTNASATRTARVLFLTPEDRLYAFPNPVPRLDSLVSFSFPLSLTVPAAFRIADERGRTVHEQAIEEPGTVVGWNLRDAAQTRVPAGVYRYTVGDSSGIVVLLP